jgi:putative methylase
VLAIGAALLGAERITGLDCDSDAIAVARENAALLDADVDFVGADARDAELPGRLGSFDSVVMNPPFGAQKAHADRPFIDLALAIAPVTYGIFNAGSIPFIEAYTAGRAEITEKIGGTFRMKRTFSHHKKDSVEIEVEIIRLIRTKP